MLYTLKMVTNMPKEAEENKNCNLWSCNFLNRFADICLPTGFYAIGFLATAGIQGKSDFGLDDLVVHESSSRCPNETHVTKGMSMQ